MSDSDESDKTSTTLSIYIDDNEKRVVCPVSTAAFASRAYQSTIHWNEAHTDDSELDEMRHDDEKILGDGSEEDDSLLVIYQNSDA